MASALQELSDLFFFVQKNQTEQAEQAEKINKCVHGGEQFDNELLNALPPSYFETLKSFHKMHNPYKKPTFEQQFFDARFFDIYYEKKKLNLYNSQYDYESILLKSAEPQPKDDFLVIYQPHKLNGCLEDLVQNQNNAAAFKNTKEIFTTPINHGMGATYVFYNNERNKNIYNVLFACREEKEGSKYTLDQYIKDLEFMIKKYEMLLSNKIHDCYEIFIKTHDLLYDNINKQRIQTINLGIQQIKSEFKELPKKQQKIFEIDMNIEYVRGKYHQLVTDKAEDSIIQQTLAYVTELENLKTSEKNKFREEEELLESIKRNIIRDGLILEDEVKSHLDPLLATILEIVRGSLKDIPFLNSMFTAPSEMIIQQVENEIVTGCDTSYLAVNFEDFLVLVEKNLEIKKIAKCEA